LVLQTQQEYIRVNLALETVGPPAVSSRTSSDAKAARKMADAQNSDGSPDYVGIAGSFSGSLKTNFEHLEDVFVVAELTL